MALREEISRLFSCPHGYPLEAGRSRFPSTEIVQERNDVFSKDQQRPRITLAGAVAATEGPGSFLYSQKLTITGNASHARFADGAAW